MSRSPLTWIHSHSGSGPENRKTYLARLLHAPQCANDNYKQGWMKGVLDEFLNTFRKALDFALLAAPFERALGALKGWSRRAIPDPFKKRG